MAACVLLGALLAPAGAGAQQVDPRAVGSDPSDATLASLTLTGAELGFDPAESQYWVAYGVVAEHPTVEAEAAQPGAQVTISPADADPATPGHQVAQSGLRVVRITVTSPDGTVKRSYTLWLYDYRLESLGVEGHDIEFDAARTGYHARVPHSTTSVTLTADTRFHTFAYSHPDADPATPGHQVSLDVGKNEITVTATPTPSRVTAAAQAYSITVTRAQACATSFDAVPTAVQVTSVPIVVDSTTADYFVLYATHDDGRSILKYPVKVVLGENGTTTLSENVPALPADRYRVEKYSVADPADVDDDCHDDVDELRAHFHNPVSSGYDRSLGGWHTGTNRITTHSAFADFAEQFASGRQRLKLVIIDIDSDRPVVYFINLNAPLRWHQSFLDSIGVESRRAQRASLLYDPNAVAPGGTQGMYYLQILRNNAPFSVVDRAYTLVAAQMPVLDNNLAVRIANKALPSIQHELARYQSSRLPLAFDQDIAPDSGFVALNQEEGYGLLRQMDPDERPNPRDVVIYETLPNELPRVAGIISTVPQTPLSHVNLRAREDGVPNAYIADALDDADISALVGSYVFYSVTESGYTVRAATQAEVEEHYAATRPTVGQTPPRDLSVTAITPLSDIGFSDSESFGVKAANMAVLRTLGFPDGTVRDGFAIPFYFYDEFMKHNELYDDVEEMLADPDFQTDFDTKEDELKKLRKKIKKADVPDWIETALTTMHASYPQGTSLRYRSSTNNEDLPGFSGAGLYDSKTQHPEETEEDGISKSLKQVYASLWNFRAFVERDFHRIDHSAAAMGVLVHPNFSDELVNGVAVSADLILGVDGVYYANLQVGEDLVTNPEERSIPEEVRLRADGSYVVYTLSNRATPGELLMTGDQYGQLRRHLATIHESFAELYGVVEGEEFAMEIEFKITSDNVLAIKQARPWVFGTLTGRFDPAPAAHDGTPFDVRATFSEDIDISADDLKDHAVTVTGGTATDARRVDGRDDLWEIEITPDGHSAVSVAVQRNLPCTTDGAICTAGGRRLMTRLERTVTAAVVWQSELTAGESPDRTPVSSGYSASGPVGALSSDSFTVGGILNSVAYLLHTGNSLMLRLNEELPIDFTLRVGDVAYTASESKFPPAMGAEAVYWWPSATPGWQTGEPTAVSITIDPETDLGSRAKAPVFAYFHSIPASHDGSEEFSFDLYFSEPVTATAEDLSGDILSVTGGSVSSVQTPFPARLFGGWAWVVTIAPDADDPVTIDLQGGVACDQDGAVCTQDGRTLFGDLRIEVPGPQAAATVAALTASTHNVPANHDGRTPFTFELRFSEAPPQFSYKTLRDHAFTVTGGRVTGARRLEPPGNIRWEITVAPSSNETVSVVLPPTSDCAAQGAICTGDRRMFSGPLEIAVAGPSA